MLNDLQLALLLQDQYDGKLALAPSALVDFSVIKDGNGVSLLYEGTHDIKDAMDDLEALMVDCPFGRAHSGAWEGLQQSFPSLPLDTPIACSGHSLGAMRAQLAYRELYRLGYRNLKCVTFECPRFCDATAMNYASGIVENRTYQNYNNFFEHDAFTMIPPHLLLEPYAEVINCARFWSAPTANNEWKEWPVNIQAHSLSDCVIPWLSQRFSS